MTKGTENSTSTIKELEAAILAVPDEEIQTVRAAMLRSFDLLLDHDGMRPQEFNAARALVRFLDEQGYQYLLDAPPCRESEALCGAVGTFIGTLNALAQRKMI